MKKVVKIFAKDGVQLPTYKTNGSSGMDVRAYFENGEEFLNKDLKMESGVIIEAGQRKLIQTGILVSIPEGYEIQVRPRSGLALKKGITVLNTPGTIDADYKGEIGVILLNTTNHSFCVSYGDRIAQIVLQEVPKITWEQVDSNLELGDSERGTGGFGHSGIK